MDVKETIGFTFVGEVEGETHRYSG
jgi:hypothetical protein